MGRPANATPTRVQQIPQQGGMAVFRPGGREPSATHIGCGRCSCLIVVKCCISKPSTDFNWFLSALHVVPNTRIILVRISCSELTKNHNSVLPFEKMSSDGS